MSMNAQQIEDFRRAILRVLDEDGSQKFGLRVPAIAALVNKFGFRPTTPEVEKQLDYLSGEPLCHVERVNKGGFSPENTAWKITTRGMNFLAENS